MSAIMDPISFTIAVSGALLTTFKSTLKVWAIIDAGRNCARKYDHLHTRLDNQRVCFLQWAERVGFLARAGYNRRLDDAPLGPAIAHTLRHIELLLSDARTLESRYGFELHRPGPRSAFSSPSLSTLMAGHDNGGYGSARLVKRRSHETVDADASSRNMYRRFVAPGQASDADNGPIAGEFERDLQQQQKETSIWQSTTWSIRDDKMFDTLVTRVAQLVADLDHMTQGIGPQSFPQAVRATLGKALGGGKGAKLSKRGKRVSNDVVGVPVLPRDLPHPKPGGTTRIRRRESTGDNRKGWITTAAEKPNRPADKKQLEVIIPVCPVVSKPKPAVPKPSRTKSKELGGDTKAKYQKREPEAKSLARRKTVSSLFSFYTQSEKSLGHQSVSRRSVVQSEPTQSPGQTGGWLLLITGKQFMALRKVGRSDKLGTP